MHVSAKRIGVFAAVAACLVAIMAFGAVAAWGAVSWQTNGPNTLTIMMKDGDEPLTVDMEVDVYQVATATPNGHGAYDYTWNAPFGEGTVQVEGLDSEGWNDLAKQAARKLNGAQIDSVSMSVASGAGSGSIGSLDDGLYLVMPHGADAPVSFAADGAVVLKAYTDQKELTFDPSFAALPTKDADEYGVISTANPGDWKTEAVIAPKFDKFPLFGKLRITKTVEGFTGEMATFVFHIVGTTPDGDTYDNYASITCTNDEVTEAVVTHIPAGTVVTVTEEQYEGMRYTLKDGDTSEKTIVADRVTDVDAGLIPVASFVNEPGPPGIGGHGVQNNFELYTESSPEKWDWVLKEVSPSSAQTDKPSNG